MLIPLVSHCCVRLQMVITPVSLQESCWLLAHLWVCPSQHWVCCILISIDILSFTMFLPCCLLWICASQFFPCRLEVFWWSGFNILSCDIGFEFRDSIVYGGSGSTKPLAHQCSLSCSKMFIDEIMICIGFTSKEINMWTGKIDQLVKCLLYKHEALSWIPRTHVKQAMFGIYLYPNTEEVETGGFLGLTGQTRLIWVFQDGERTCLRIQGI